MSIEWLNVTSTNIAMIGYDPDTQELRVHFNDGAEYAYEDVSAATFQKFRESDSKGKYFHQHIKGKFTFQKM